MAFRGAQSILTNSASSDVGAEADVIMTAALLGFAASRVMADSSVRFDLDPLDARDAAAWQEFQTVVSKIDTAVADHLDKTGRAPSSKVHSGTAPDYAKGAVIMGVYQLAGQSAPASVSDPVL